MRKLVSGAVAAVVMVTGMVVVTGEAAAAGTCPQNLFCLFKSTSYNEGHANLYENLATSDSNLTNNYWANAILDSVNDDTSSVINRKGCDVMLWQNAGFSGDHTKSIKGTADPNLGNNVIGDNRLSSVDICV